MYKEAAFLQRLHESVSHGVVPKKYEKILRDFHHGYLAEQLPARWEWIDHLFSTFLGLVVVQLNSPYSFPPYHRAVRVPFDYYQFGIDFFCPLVDQSASILRGVEYIQEIVLHIQNGNNVILFANHQIEADPQAISIMLATAAPALAEAMIFIAGERVVTDPLAVPFSIGRNLLCIYSKRYITHPPERKMHKQLHNKKTMELMRDLLGEGGKCIYVAPSGGRDRVGPSGRAEVASFDPQSIEMLYLMAQQSTCPTFFYTLSLYTYDLLPPPGEIQVELGEVRKAQRGSIYMAFGRRIDMDHYPGCDAPDKRCRRQLRAQHIWEQVEREYEQFFS